MHYPVSVFLLLLLKQAVRDFCESSLRHWLTCLIN